MPNIAGIFAVIWCFTAVTIVATQVTGADQAGEETNIRRYPGLALQSAENFIAVEPYLPYQPESDGSVQAVANSRRKRFFSILSPADRLRTLYIRSGKAKAAAAKVARSGMSGYGLRPE